MKKFMYQFLNSHPQLKNFARSVYLRALYCAAKPKAFLKLPKGNFLPAEAVTGLDSHCFFGYYDKCPWDKTGRYLLYHQVHFGDRMPKPGESASLAFVDLQNNNQPHILGQTLAWCWQQGSMLQWLGGDPESLVIHNDLQHNQYISVIRNTKGEIKKTLALPVYAISKDGRQALSLNFGRLHYGSPGYGYVAADYAATDVLYPADDGIWHIDLQTGRYKLIISLEQIVKDWPKEGISNSFHYFNHLEFNHDGMRFVFLHRWFEKLKGSSRGRQYTRMFTANPDGTEIYCLADHPSISHFAWKDDNHILLWTWRSSHNNAYYLLEDRTAKAEIVGKDILTEDGHPSYSPDSQYLITDTYPDKARLRTLILFDLLNAKRTDIGRYNAPFKFSGPWRCDLHPRWSRDGKKVCFDSVHEGVRRIYAVDLSSVL